MLYIHLIFWGADEVERSRGIFWLVGSVTIVSNVLWKGVSEQSRLPKFFCQTFSTKRYLSNMIRNKLSFHHFSVGYWLPIIASLVHQQSIDWIHGKSTRIHDISNLSVVTHFLLFPGWSFYWLKDTERGGEVLKIMAAKFPSADNPAGRQYASIFVYNISNEVCACMYSMRIVLAMPTTTIDKHRLHLVALNVGCEILLWLRRCFLSLTAPPDCSLQV